jgi:NitT/TauT family transport system permease protein
MDTDTPPQAGKHRARRKGKQPSVLVVLFWQVALFVAILAAWEIAIRLGWLRIYVYGAPSGIIQAFGKQIADGSLLVNFWITAEESLLGFLLGSVVGSLCGLLLWLSDLAGRVLRPYMVALNGVPKIALAPLIIVWFGLGLQSKIAIAAIITFIVAFITAYNGTQLIDADYVRMMRSLGARQLQIFRIVVIPGSLAWIVAAFRLNVGFALIGAVVGEYISAERGLGQMVYYAGQMYDLNSVWVGIFSLMLMALMFEAMVRWVELRIQW